MHIDLIFAIYLRPPRELFELVSLEAVMLSQHILFASCVMDLAIQHVRSDPTQSQTRAKSGCSFCCMEVCLVVSSLTLGIRKPSPAQQSLRDLPVHPSVKLSQ